MNRVTSLLAFVCLLVVGGFLLAEGVGDTKDGFYGKYKTFVTVRDRWVEDACGTWLRCDAGTLGAIYKDRSNENPYVAVWPGKISDGAGVPYAMFFQDDSREFVLQIPAQNGHGVTQVPMSKIVKLIHESK